MTTTKTASDPLSHHQTCGLRWLQSKDADDVLLAFQASDDMNRQGAVTDYSQALVYVENLSESGGRHYAFAVTDDDTLVGLVVVT